MSITILDYGLGNIQSLYSAISSFSRDVIVDNSGDKVRKSDILIIPGVASFGAGISNLKKLNLFDEIQQHSIAQKPLLGVCLGAQMILDKSEESVGVGGLSIVNGTNSIFKDTKSLIPNQGWAKLNILDKSSNLTQFHDNYFYFSHSYVMKLKDQSNIIADSLNNNERFTSIYKCNNIIGLQFHPERSGKIGVELLKMIINNLRNEL